MKEGIVDQSCSWCGWVREKNLLDTQLPQGPVFLSFHLVLKILGENLPENREDIAAMLTALSSCHKENEQCMSGKYKITVI